MRIVMAGGSGFLGTSLRRRLANDGHEVVQLVRGRTAGAGQREWHPDRGELDRHVLADADAVVNLAGAGVGDKRWNAAYKRILVESRVGPTGTIARALATLPASQRPAVLLNASAIGFYGDTGETAVDEESPPGQGFFPRLCQAWEAATLPAQAAGVRTMALRTGLVLDRDGGLLKRLLLPFSLGLGGRLSDGRQWTSWISLDDWVGAVVFLLARADGLAGPVNLVGPAPVRNIELTRALGTVLRRPTVVPVPAIGLRLLLGEFAGEALASQRVLPGALQRVGFGFRQPDLDRALRAALRR